jgi:hypothetical protein
MEVYVMAIGGGKTLTIYLAADLKKFNQGMTQAQTGLKGFANTMSNNLGPALLAAGAAAGVFALKLAGDAIGAARDLAETQNKVGVIFGESSKSILTFAENAVTGLGQTQQQALDAAATFAQFGKAAGLSGTDLAGFSTELVTLSADLASFNNSSPEQAITAIGAALRGEAEPLRNFGVLLDDATLRARAMEMGIYQGSGALTQQQKVLAAHQEILAQTTDAQGDFSRTSEGLANTQKILQAAVEDAKAEIGEGLVQALEAASAAMGGTKGMAGVIQQTGQDVGDFTRGIGILVEGLAELTGTTNTASTANKDLEKNTSLLKTSSDALTKSNIPLAQALGAQIGIITNLGTSSREASEKVDELYDSTIALAKAQRFAAFDAQQAKKDAIATAYDSGIAAKQEADYIERMTKILGHVPLAFQVATDKTDTNTAATGSNTKAVEKLTKREQELIDLHATKSANLDDNRTKLGFYTAELQKATDAIESFTSGMQANLLAGVDLGAAFTGQFDEAGAATGVSLLEGFTNQINQAEYFGGVLAAIKAQGADSRLIEQIAGLGPEVGAQLGQQMLDEGLVPTLNDKFLAVQETTRTLAMGLVPEFRIAGQESALTMVDEISEQMAKEVLRLAKIGKKIAKPLGQSFKAQLMSDVAEALRAVEASGAAGRAEVVAQAEQRQINLTNAAVANALQNLVRSADARNGAPISPVNR